MTKEADTKKYFLTIFIIFAMPTILITIKNFDTTIINIILKKCLHECVILPMFTYFMMKNSIKLLLFNLKLRGNNEDSFSVQLFIHSYIILIISIISICIKILVYAFQPITNYYIYKLVTFQITVYSILAILSLSLSAYLYRELF